MFVSHVYFSYHTHLLIALAAPLVLHIFNSYEIRFEATCSVPVQLPPVPGRYVVSCRVGHGAVRSKCRSLCCPSSIDGHVLTPQLPHGCLACNVYGMDGSALAGPLLGAVMSPTPFSFAAVVPVLASLPSPCSVRPLHICPHLWHVLSVGR